MDTDIVPHRIRVGDHVRDLSFCADHLWHRVTDIQGEGVFKFLRLDGQRWMNVDYAQGELGRRVQVRPCRGAT